MQAIEAIHAQQLHDQGDGTVTATVVNPAGLVCWNPGNDPKVPDRPAIVGDVYSVNGAGQLGARPAGTNGAWEKARIVGASLVFAPAGPAGVAVILPYVGAIPNA